MTALPRSAEAASCSGRADLVRCWAGHGIRIVFRAIPSHPWKSLAVPRPGQYPMGQAMTASFCSSVTNSRTSEEQMSTIAKGLNHATMWRSRRTRATRKPQQLDASSD